MRLHAHSNLKKAAFFDRDGVINKLVDRGEGFLLGGKPFRYTAPFNLGELQVNPQAHEALALAQKKGYLTILATNQPDIATGHIDPEEFERMTEVIRALPLDDVFICKHRPGTGCACRKPAPGMLLQARDRHAIDMSLSIMIGDQESDVEAGIRAGVRTMRVTDDFDIVTRADHRVRDIMEAAALLP